MGGGVNDLARDRLRVPIFDLFSIRRFPAAFALMSRPRTDPAKIEAIIKFHAQLKAAQMKGKEVKIERSMIWKVRDLGISIITAWRAIRKAKNISPS